jgi:hypothetical protein
MHYETAFIVIVVVALAAIYSSDASTCNCLCCTDNRCTQTSSVNFIVSTCESCRSTCQNKLSSTCASAFGHASYECRNGNLISRLSAKANWIGAFRVTEECDTDSCCCLTDTVYLTRTMDNNLRIQGEFTGSCPAARPILDETFSMPNSSSTRLRLLNQWITIKLSDNDRNVDFLDIDNIDCSYKAVRVNDASFMAIHLVLVILLSSFTSIKMFFI